MSDMKGGWFVGNFEPTTHKTEGFEVGYKFHKKGEKQDTHYHKKGTEISYLLRGKFKIQDTILVAGDIFTIYPYEITNPEFLEDCEFLVVKIPSIPGDKYVIED
jgi:quercetin dioxygenase-like cupin family protein